MIESRNCTDWEVRNAIQELSKTHNFLSEFPAKAQRRKENRKGKQNESPLRLSLRLCAFAGQFLLRALGLLIFLSVNIAAQASVRSVVTISLTKPDEIRVEAELSTPMRSWSFRNAYAGALGIAERVQDFRASDAVVEKAATGEFRADHETRRISYTIKLPKPTLADVTHFSWILDDRGFLMFADLVPLEIRSLSAAFVLPQEWSVESSFPRDANGRYEVAEPEKAVFFIGRALRKSSSTVAGMPLDIVLSGKWPFKESDALEPAVSLMQKYLALTGFRLPGKSTIMIAPLPVNDRKPDWKAETRGSTVVLLVNPHASFKRWAAQFTVIFAHEILHLWVPNSLKLAGDYDWFFEGFTLYTALCTSLELRVIDFKEYLNTLGRVYDSYRSQPDDDLSLLEESGRRWFTAGQQVYVKGMLVAFLYDLLLRKESGGRKTLLDAYRDLFSRPTAAGADGNEAIISVLGSTPVARNFIRSYVETSKKVELEQILPAYGLSVDSTGKGALLRVSGGVNEDQKRLLRSLGYRD